MVSEAQSDLELAYFAGLFDGEGCISSTAGNRYNLQISISGLWPTIEPAHRRFGGTARQISYTGATVVASGRSLHPGYTKNTHRAVWQVFWSNEQARTLLQSLLPFLREKREQAEIALRYLDFRRSMRGIRRHREWLTAIEERVGSEVARALKALHRGETALPVEWPKYERPPIPML